MGWSNLRIARQTMKDHWRMTVFLTLLFIALSAMYVGVYPAVEDMLDQFADTPFEFFRGFEYIGTYAGFLNLELYQIFWVLLLAILIAYLGSSLMSEEMESKTIEMLLANPVSRRRVILEKFLGIVPLILIVNFVTMGTVLVMTAVIGEELSFYNLSLTHLASIPYFLSIAALSVAVSVFIDKKMKSALIVMGTLIGMYVVKSIAGIAPEYDALKYISLTHYLDPTETIIHGQVDLAAMGVLTAVMIVSLVVAVIHFERRDITIS